MKSSVKSRISLLTKLAYFRKKAEDPPARSLQEVIADSPLLSAISYINQVLTMPAYTSGLPANIAAALPSYQQSLQTLFQQALQAKPDTIKTVFDSTVQMFEFLAKLNPDANSQLSKYVNSYISYINSARDEIFKQYADTTAAPTATPTAGTAPTEIRNLEQAIADSALLSGITYVNQILSTPKYTAGIDSSKISSYQEKLKTLFQNAIQAQPNTIQTVLSDTLKTFDELAKLAPNSELARYVNIYMSNINTNKDSIVKDLTQTASGVETSFKLRKGHKHTSKYPFVPPELQKSLKVTPDGALGPTTRAAMDKKKKELNNSNMTDLELYKKVRGVDYDPEVLSVD